MIPLLLAALAGPATNPPPDSDAVVAVYAQQPSGDRAAQGSGFFVADGLVITAYHVIQGARAITVLWHGRSYPDVLVEAIDPRHDLARLRISHLSERHHRLRIAPARLGGVNRETLRVVGWPRGQDNSVMYGRMTTEGLTDSRHLRNEEGHRVFGRAMWVLALDVTTYNGLSGAPVISSRGVVAVLSGSYHVGGGIAWGIPVQYLDSLRSFSPARAANQIQWPPFDLVDASLTKSLRADYSYDPRMEALFVDAAAVIDSAQRVMSSAFGALDAVSEVISRLATYDSAALRTLRSSEGAVRDSAIRRFWIVHNALLQKGEATVNSSASFLKGTMFPSFPAQFNTLAVLLLHAGSNSPEAIFPERDRQRLRPKLDSASALLAEMNPWMRRLEGAKVEILRASLRYGATLQGFESGSAHSDSLADVEHLLEVELETLAFFSDLVRSISLGSDYFARYLVLLQNLHEFFVYRRLDMEDEIGDALISSVCAPKDDERRNNATTRIPDKRGTAGVLLAGCRRLY